MNLDHQMMARALDLAAEGRHSTSPNPMVGCVVVKEGKIIGTGWHERAGKPHAEVLAIEAAGEASRGATAYVNLEPCCHTGRTGPCTDVLIRAGVSRVVVAISDPNPKVDGMGIQALRTEGIHVDVGVLADEAESLNEKFLFAARTGLPFVLLKAGMTTDGKLATEGGRKQWITSPPSLERSLLLREEYDAILVGSGTVIADDPRLTRRLGLNHAVTPWRRVVVDSSGEIPADSHVFDRDAETIVYVPNASWYAGTAKNVAIVEVAGQNGRLDLREVLADLHRRGVGSVIAEGGAKLHTSLIEQELWRKVTLFVAPMFLGGAHSPSIFDREVADLDQAYRFRFDSVERIGDDLQVTGYNDRA